MPDDNKPRPRSLQQQPQRQSHPQQQRAGATSFQSRGQVQQGQEDGEGGDTGARDADREGRSHRRDPR